MTSGGVVSPCCRTVLERLPIKYHGGLLGPSQMVVYGSLENYKTPLLVPCTLGGLL